MRHIVSCQRLQATPEVSLFVVNSDNQREEILSHIGIFRELTSLPLLASCQGQNNKQLMLFQ